MEDINGFSLKSLSIDEINKIDTFRKSRQTAVLTILFSDIVNSSYATEKLGEEKYSHLRHIHDELFTRIMCSDNAGVIIKQIGDSFLCVFAEPSTAVFKAVEFQRAIHANKEHLTANGYTLTVRIGINIGQVVVENTLAMDIFGTHVNRSARLEAIAHGGQVITSQSVWENAAGWLKDHNEKNIAWIAYGKVKLKGIEKAVDIYGFYAKELGKPKEPKIVGRRKKKNTLLRLSGLVIAAVAFMFFFKQLNNKSSTVLHSDIRRTYYVQFDFSELKDSMKQLGIDTVALQDDLLSQVIALLSPDSVITEQDLIKQFSKQGKIYLRRFSNNLSIDTVGFFSDSLHLRGSLFIKALKSTEPVKDSFTMLTTFAFYEKNDSGSSTKTTEYDELYSLKNTGNDFREQFMNVMLEIRKWDMQGYVLSSDDSILLFHLTKKAQLREGTALKFTRRYQPGKAGLLRRLDDVKKYLDFYKKDPAYSSYVKRYTKEFTEIKNLLKLENGKEVNYGGMEINIRGRVVEVYDSTGKATWHTTEPYPEKPEAGDEIYYK